MFGNVSPSLGLFGAASVDFDYSAVRIHHSGSLAGRGSVGSLQSDRSAQEFQAESQGATRRLHEGSTRPRSSRQIVDVGSYEANRFGRSAQPRLLLDGPDAPGSHQHAFQAHHFHVRVSRAAPATRQFDRRASRRRRGLFQYDRRGKYRRKNRDFVLIFSLIQADPNLEPKRAKSFSRIAARWSDVERWWSSRRRHLPRSRHSRFSWTSQARDGDWSHRGVLAAF